MSTRFALTTVEDVPLNFHQRARLVELVREEIARVESGDTTYGRREENEEVLAELTELVELLNTPR
jgi:hypothetical protein